MDQSAERKLWITHLEVPQVNRPLLQVDDPGTVCSFPPDTNIEETNPTQNRKTNYQTIRPNIDKLKHESSYLLLLSCHLGQSCVSKQVPEIARCEGS